jgi:hypothetical protein
MAIRNPFLINHLRTLSFYGTGECSLFLPMLFLQIRAKFSPHPGFLCFHALTNCPIYNSFVLITMQQYRGVVVGARGVCQ